jgi:hypothetical protein
MMDQFQSVAVAEMSLEILRQIATIEGDPAVKIAALRAAADTIQQSVLVAGLTAVMKQSLTPKN